MIVFHQSRSFGEIFLLLVAIQKKLLRGREDEHGRLAGMTDTAIHMMIARLTTMTILHPSGAAKATMINVSTFIYPISTQSLTETGRPRRRDSYSDSSVSRSPPRRRKSMGEQALAALGLGGLAAAATGKSGGHGRARHHRDSSSSRSRSRHRGGKPRGKEDIAQVLKAAVTAGAAEAFRSRNQPGGWAGDKGKRVLTAAISAGGVDKLIDRDPHKHGKRNVIGSALAGLATNHFVNGSRSRSRSRGRDYHGRDGRGRARSESRSGLKELAGAGLITAAGKSIYDKVRSKSRGRRSSTSSSDSYDSRSPRHRHDKKKKRSSSISAYASKGLAALGLGEAADKLNGRDKHRSATFDEESYHHRSSRNGAPPPYGGGGGYSDSRDVGQPRSGENSPMIHRDANGLELGPRHFGDPETDSDSDLGDSSADERARRKARGSQLITAGLATVATIHAAHGVAKSMEARDERHKAVAVGDISHDQARREKNKARLQDAASISIAALGIKGAVSEWKEMKEKRQEALLLKEKQQRHRVKREARRLKVQSMGLQDRYTDSAPTLSPQPSTFSSPGPTYYDDNPYSTSHLPAAPYYPQVASPPPPPHGHPPARF
jgi:hypothetical protein